MVQIRQGFILLCLPPALGFVVERTVQPEKNLPYRFEKQSSFKTKTQNENRYYHCKCSKIGVWP